MDKLLKTLAFIMTAPILLFALTGEASDAFGSIKGTAVNAILQAATMANDASRSPRANVVRAAVDLESTPNGYDVKFLGGVNSAHNQSFSIQGNAPRPSASGISADVESETSIPMRPFVAIQAAVQAALADSTFMTDERVGQWSSGDYVVTYLQRSDYVLVYVGFGEHRPAIESVGKCPIAKGYRIYDNPFRVQETSVPCF
jgi:hypothetical protein